MDSATPRLIDLDATAARLSMFYGRKPDTTFAARRGSAEHLGAYRDGMLLMSKSAGTGHWEVHRHDELLYVLDGEMIVDILEKDGPRTFVVGAGMLCIVPPSAWHRVRSGEGMSVFSATDPGDHIDLDIPDPRSPDRALETPTSPPSVIDLQAELAKLTMFRRTPHSTPEERKGSVAQLAKYRDGLLLAIKLSGKDYWERHLTGDELVYVLDGAATVDMVCDDGPPNSFALGAGSVAVIPQGAWHRFQSPEGFTQLVATPFPGETLALDIDDPRSA